VPGLAQVAERLGGTLPLREPSAGPQAAVAVVLREAAGGLEVLLIRRAEHPRDPWSGHVSLPGGRREPSDAGLLATAVRETLEEVGLDLAAAAPLGALETMRPRLAIFRRLTIAPFVFALPGAFEPRLSSEVVRTFWLPLGPVRRGELDGGIVWRAAGVPLHLPAWKFDGETVWGLTHRILKDLLERLGPAVT